MSEILEMMQKIRFSGVEAAADFYGSSPHVHPHNSKRESFKDGAEWQKEQDKEIHEVLKQIIEWHDIHNAISFIDEEILANAKRLL